MNCAGQPHYTIKKEIRSSQTGIEEKEVPTVIQLPRLSTIRDIYALPGFLLRPSLHNDVVPTHHLILHRLTKDIHLCAGKSFSRDSLLKQDVQFCECASSRLRDAEVGVDNAAKADATLCEE